MREDVVGTDPAPDDVWFASEDCVAILESGSPIVGPSHLEHARRTLYTLDSQASPKLTARPQVVDKLRDRGEERCLLSQRQAIEVRAEPSEPRERRHRPSALATPDRGLGSTAQRVEKVLARGEDFRTTGSEIGVSLPLSLLPLRLPEPGLRGVNDLSWAEQDAVLGDLRVEEVALLEARCSPDLFGEGQLALGSERCTCHRRIVQSESLTRQRP